MATKIEFDIASSQQIEATLGRQIESIRLARNLTQKQLSEQAGVGLRTQRRLEKGEGVSLDTLIRVLMALGLQSRLGELVPDSRIRPVERVSARKEERKRARPKTEKSKRGPWKWGDSEDKDE